jgi:hypothetical protein
MPFTDNSKMADTARVGRQPHRRIEQVFSRKGVVSLLSGFSFLLPYIELNKQTVIALDLARGVESGQINSKIQRGELCWYQGNSRIGFWVTLKDLRRSRWRFVMTVVTPCAYREY